MYSKLYRKEIIEIFSKVLKGLKEPVRLDRSNYSQYSAVLEYLYCKLYNIEIKNDEIVKKYKVTSKEFKEAVRVLNIPF